MKAIRWIIIVLIILLGLGVTGYLWLNRGDGDLDQDDPQTNSALLTKERGDLINLVKAYEPLKNFMAADPKVFSFRVRSIDNDKGVVDVIRWAGSTAFVYRFYVDGKSGTCRGQYDLYPLDKALLTVYNSEPLRKFVKDKSDKVVLRLIAPPDKDSPSIFLISVVDYHADGEPIATQFNVDIQQGSVEDVDI